MILRRRLRESLINNLLLNATDLAPYKLHFSRDKSLVSQLCLRCYVRQNGQVNKNDIGLRRVTRKKKKNCFFETLVLTRRKGKWWDDVGGQWGRGGV